MNVSVTQADTRAVDDAQNIVNTDHDSGEKFQKFIYELFEKNGVLNDLRSSLRRHIVDVLKSAQTGDPSTCLKHYTQRLDLTFQALNILIAEYLLRSEINYSLSVFLTEIPLANMVFSYAKSLMDSNNQDVSALRFTDNDVWSILNYLGVKCDSKHASNILEMYKKNQHCLLLCILKCLPMYQKPIPEGAHDISSEENLLSSKSSGTLNDDRPRCPHEPAMRNTCRHIATCKTCKACVCRIKEKYKNKKKQLYQNFINTNTKPLNVEKILKNVGVMERKLIDEMFHQLKSVYEAEVEMVKNEEDNKVRRSVASHSLQLQQQREELEKLFQARQMELEENIVHKKKFLWSLARALREQLQHLGTAMRDVRAETKRLSEKETMLKSQLLEAEQILKNRAEEMRTQISEELSTLEVHLATIKTERDTINKERSALENLKNVEHNITKVNLEREEMRSRYDLLKNELFTLKQNLQMSALNPKRVTEKGTVTDLHNIHSNLNVTLNNNQTAEKIKGDDDRLKNQVVNDFKKKNVNFSPVNFDELYREHVYSNSQSSESSEAGDAARPSQAHHSKDVDEDTVNRLKAENNRLKECAKQQSHMSSQARSGACACACSSLRPRTAAPTVSTPTPCQPQYFLHSVNACASANTVSMSWYKGAGEELNMFTDTQPRILVPGDSIPFVGVLRGRHVTKRKQMLNQWRSLRSRQLQLSRVRNQSPSPSKDRAGSSGQQSSVSQSNRPATSRAMREAMQLKPKTITTAMHKKREKSPKSVLREAKEKLRNIKDLTVATREKTPNSVLHEAKLRLRKLEIEAEAVEQSYLDFRRRQSELRVERNSFALRKDDTRKTSDAVRNLDTRGNPTVHKQEVKSTNEVDIPLTDYQASLKDDFDRYLRGYQANLDIRDIHDKATTATTSVQPIPESYKNHNIQNNSEVRKNDYLETPMPEFRKLYHSVRQGTQDGRVISFGKRGDTDNDEIRQREYQERSKLRPKSPTYTKIDKESELKILKENISKMYSVSIDNTEQDSVKEDAKVHSIAVDTISNAEDQNLLRVEVESGNGIRSGGDEILLVVQNPIGRQGMKISDGPYSSNIAGQMTVIVSPKEVCHENIEDIDVDVDFQRPKRTPSPEQQARLTRNDVLEAIFNAEPNSNELLKESMSKLSLSGSEEKGDEDDFLADVDNYNSHLNTPISLVKTSEDENVWEM